MQTPPMPPVTQRFGNGLGQEGSTSNLGALPCACIGASDKTPRAMASPAACTAIRTKLDFLFILSLFAKLESGGLGSNSQFHLVLDKYSPRVAMAAANDISIRMLALFVAHQVG